MAEIAGCSDYSICTLLDAEDTMPLTRFEAISGMAGGVSSFLEQILWAGLMGIPLLGTVLLGDASVSMIYIYWLTFDFLKNLAHCNVEIVPVSAFRTLPVLRHLLITPS